MTNMLSNLNGTWLAIYQEFEGNEIPPAAYEGQQLTLQENTYTVIGAKTDEGIIKVNGQNLDIYGTDGANKGRHYSAIYQIEDNQLTICYNLAGTSHPRDFKTTGKSQFFLAKFQRIVTAL